jgi:hypothetical protein
MSTVIVASERDRAKQVIAEIIRAAGGMLTSKSELVRVYWRAHLVFAESQPGYLSFWPVLKTPAGPVIKDVDRLLGELVADGILQIDEPSGKGVAGFQLELSGQPAPGEIADEAVEAIEKAVAHPVEPIDLADYHSLRSWNDASDGDELNIYVDVIPDDEYADRKRRLEEMAALLDIGKTASTARGLTDDEYQRQLVASGLMQSVKPRRRDQQAFDRYQPVEIAGKPLSDTIIEERR